MNGLFTKLSHVVDDWGEVGGAVKLHLGQTLLVGLDHTFNAWTTRRGTGHSQNQRCIYGCILDRQSSTAIILVVLVNRFNLFPNPAICLTFCEVPMKIIFLNITECHLD